MNAACVKQSNTLVVISVWSTDEWEEEEGDETPEQKQEVILWKNLQNYDKCVN